MRHGARRLARSSVGRRGDRRCAHGAAATRTRRDIDVVALACPRRHVSLGRRGRIRRRSGWSARSAISTALAPTDSPRRAALARSRPLGRAAAARRRSERRAMATPMRSCPSKARACTRSRWARCMPASSSPAISASPPTARRWCGWRSGWATSTRASSALMAGAPIEQGGAARRPRLRRQHRRLCHRLRPRGRGGARHRAAAARAVWLRALMAELERIANHLGDIGAICNDAAFALMHRPLRRAARAGAARRRRPASAIG